MPQIVDLLCGDGLADEARIGAAGVSMGGMITYGAATADPRIRQIGTWHLPWAVKENARAAFLTLAT